MKNRTLVVDCFAGGGGASLGIEQGIGRPVDVAINHDRQAIAMHEVNHPDTLHYQNDIHDVDPEQVARGRIIDLLWASPDCTHHSKARGGKPREQGIRDLAWVVPRWAEAVHPRVIMLENVEEFQDWGPLDPEGKIIRERKGETFREWRDKIASLGYEIEFRELRACDYGAPTIRRRLFMVARRDGEAITWPEPTHGYEFAPLRTAAECIDWDIECPSIFERSRPLAPATMRRIAHGIKRYVIEAQSPFIVSLTHHGGERVEGLTDPFQTITAAHRGEKALVTPYVTRFNQNGAGSSMDEPLDTVMAGATRFGVVAPYIVRQNHDGQGKPADSVGVPLRTITTQHNKHALVMPTLIQTGYGERPGQAPRVPGLHKPLGTLVDGGKHALVSAFLAKHFGGHETPGASLDRPASTVTAKDHHALVASSLVKLYGTSTGASVDVPMPTVTSTGQHIAEVRAFLMHYYSGGGQTQSAAEPVHVITTKDRVALGVVWLAGEPWQIVDIGMRMLTPRELFRAQGFPDGYVIDPIVDGKPLTKTAQIRMVGNSVCPPAARALVEANVGRLGQQHIWMGHELAEAAL